MLKEKKNFLGELIAFLMLVYLFFYLVEVEVQRIQFLQ